MVAKKLWILVSLLMVFLVGCSSAGQGGPSSGQENLNAESFSASVTSAISVDLAWVPVVDASSYLIEAKYGNGDYFEVAELGNEQTAYTHFVVPNSKELTYKLSAVEARGNQEIGTATVSMPELAPNPVVITDVVQFAPIVGESPIDFGAMATLDPLNPDPNAIATMAAFASGIDPNNLEELVPEVTPVSVSQVVGAEGGSISITDPNGVFFNLEIPADAVDENTIFTLNPIESINDLPFDSLLGAVQIYPLTQFHIPLTLAITLPDGVDSGSETPVAFVVSSFNQELSLTPIYQDGNTFMVSASWGDIIGIASGSAEEISNQAMHVPSDSGEQILQQIAVMQALTADSGAESFASIINQVFEGLVQSGENSTGNLYRGNSGLLAAPALQGSRTGINLWNKISAASAAAAATEFNPNGDPDRNVVADQLRNSAGRGMLIDGLINEIKQFLDTHTGCRTRDEFYAQAMLDLLSRPKPGFEQDMATAFRDRFGSPSRLKNCTFTLQIKGSTIKVEAPDPEGGKLIQTFKVHTIQFNLQVVGRGNEISLQGNTAIIYDRWSALFTDCPPEINPTPLPQGHYVYITDLHPIFDEDLKVVDFRLISTSDPVSGNLSRSRLTTEHKNGKCKIVKAEFGGTPPPEMWGPAFYAMHNRSFNFDNWIITGETSYNAINSVSNARPQGPGSITEVTEMELTVTQEGQ